MADRRPLGQKPKGADKPSRTNRLMVAQMTKDYGIDGVPTVAVQGTYEVSADLPQTPDDASILRAVDYLVAQVHDGGAAAR